MAASNSSPRMSRADSNAPAFALSKCSRDPIEGSVRSSCHRQGAARPAPVSGGDAQKQNFFKITLHRTVASSARLRSSGFRLYELLVDLGLSLAARALRDRGGPKGQLAAKLAYPIADSKPTLISGKEAPARLQLDAHRDRINNAEDGDIAGGVSSNMPCADLLRLRRILGSSAPAWSMNVSLTHVSAAPTADRGGLLAHSALA